MYIHKHVVCVCVSLSLSGVYLGAYTQVFKGASISSFLSNGVFDVDPDEDEASFEQVTLIQETVSIKFVTGVRLIFL
jgi:hypothetical protein